MTNIIPSFVSELSYTEYDQILEESTDRFVRPAAEQEGLQVSINKPGISLRDLLPGNITVMLREFSDAANKADGALDPLDRRRWEAFVVAAHRAHTYLDPAALRRWLIDEERWPADAADQLSIEYERDRSILEEYDRQVQND